MAVIHHAEHPDDRTAMLAMRSAIAAGGNRTLGPEARPAFDAMIARTPRAAGVTYETAFVGGVPGWWCRPAEDRDSGSILYHHGGAYVLGSAEAYRHIAGQIAAKAGMSVFVADYGLAPERPFPAAAHDALSAYRGLVATGFGRIVLVGDSAGGGLTLSLLAAVAADRALPVPAGALVLSPWTDLTLSGSSIESRAQADPLLGRRMLADAAATYLDGASRSTPLASPLYGNLAGLPPVQIHVGGDEILLDDSLRYGERFTVAGGFATVHVWAGMTHVFPASIGTLHAAEAALSIGSAFLEDLLEIRNVPLTDLASGHPTRN